MTDDDIQVDAVDFLEHLPLLGAGAVEQILERLPEETVDAIRVRLGVDSGGRGSALAFGALLLGAGIGGGLAYFFTKRALETKYTKIADDEIAEMKLHYQAKIKAAESTATKLAPVKTIVTERGYANPPTEGPPMAVQPPRAVAASEDAVADESPEPEPEPEPPVVRNIFRDSRQPIGEWDWHEERRHRSPDAPYVIHYDERHELEGYAEESLTYYTKDDVLCNDRDEVIDPDEERERLVGEANLDKFGHGSGDADIVFVRNDELEIMYEIVRSDNSFVEEVHGLKHEGWNRRNLERMRSRERDEDEE